jgi:hypothetical protein
MARRTAGHLGSEKVCMNKIFFSILALACIAGVVGCSQGDAATDVKSIQADAQKKVPSNLGEVPRDKALDGVLNPEAKALKSGGKVMPGR